MSFSRVMTFDTGLFLAPSASKIKEHQLKPWVSLVGSITSNISNQKPATACQVLAAALAHLCRRFSCHLVTMVMAIFPKATSHDGRRFRSVGSSEMVGCFFIGTSFAFRVCRSCIAL